MGKHDESCISVVYIFKNNVPRDAALYFDVIYQGSLALKFVLTCKGAYGSDFSISQKNKICRNNRLKTNVEVTIFFNLIYIEFYPKFLSIMSLGHWLLII